MEADLVGQLLKTLDNAIEQAKIELPAERSQGGYVVEKQEELRRSAGTYRQDPRDENRAQLFVDYQDAYQAYMHLAQSIQEAFQKRAQEFERDLEEAEVGAEQYHRAVDDAHDGAEPYRKAVEQALTGAQSYHKAVEETLATVLAAQTAINDYSARRIMGAQEALDSFWSDHKTP